MKNALGLLAMDLLNAIEKGDPRDIPFSITNPRRPAPDGSEIKVPLEADVGVDVEAVATLLRLGLADETRLGKLVDKVGRAMDGYVKSTRFDKRLSALVERFFELMIERMLLGSESIRNELADEIHQEVLLRVREQWEERVKRESEKLLEAALTEVRAKFGGAS